MHAPDPHVTSGPARACVIAGAAGSGKSTVAAVLGAELGWPVLDADALHSAEAVARMAAGHGLSEAERAPWLARVAAAIDGRLGRGESVVVACSALRREHRRALMRDGVRFVLLDVPEVVLADRLRDRTGHFAGPALLPSQLAALEPPTGDEPVLLVDGTLPPSTIASRILAACGLLAGDRETAGSARRPPRGPA